ncbi:mitochondrial import receptor subunit tom-70 [Drechslerella stenobrocha 248]|uniref:Mitochondrial import receptor subunit tom-70 n=1 Tax=Drechslerella stenobrocha 248 TaxID=1043628 RepID=W7IHW2_9PEZI|nr:mitochondrial import receptor subunit tom-70 [Drechslerella stenobrocha 248]
MSTASIPSTPATPSLVVDAAASSSLWSRLSSWIADNKAVTYTVGAVVIVVTGAGAIYYINSQKGDLRRLGDLPGSETSSEKQDGSIRKKKKKRTKAGKKDEATSGQAAAAEASAPPTPTAEPELELPDVNESTIETFTAEERKMLAGKLKDAGNKSYNSKEYNDAIALYTKAILCKPDPIFYSNRAACYNAQGNWSAVIEDTTAAIALNPAYVKAINRRAHAYEQTEEYSKALLDYTASCILESFKNDNAALSVERLLKIVAETKGRKMLEGRPKRLPSPTFVTNYLQSFREKPVPEGLEDATDESSGDYYLNKGLRDIQLKTAQSYEEASQSFEKALELGVSDKYLAFAHNMRGTFKYLKGDGAEALEDITSSIDIDPTMTQSYIKRASISLENGDKEAAEEDFARAVTFSPDDPDIYYHRAQLHFISFEYTEAARDYQKSIDLDRDFIYSHIQLGVTQYKQGSIASSMATFRRCVKNFESSPDVFNYYGELLLDQTKFEEAIEKFDRAIDLEKKEKPMGMNVLPLINKALAVFQWKQNYEEAERLCQKALILDPDCDIAIATIAQLLLQQGKVEEALTYFERAADLSRTEPEIVNALSYAEATRTQLQVQELYPHLANRPMAMPRA